MFNKVSEKKYNAGFISTRFAGTDGVSLETQKWADVLKELCFSSFYFAGECDRPENVSYIAKLASFMDPEIAAIHEKCFGVQTRDRNVAKKIHEIKEDLKDDIYRFIEDFKIDFLIPENALTIPINIPLGMAITEVVAETGIPTIAHHHDFFWERQRFMINAVWEYLNMAFPPHVPNIQHVVINSSADNQLSLRTGISATIIPNVMDFDNPPPSVYQNPELGINPGTCPYPEHNDNYAADVRKDLGIEDDELLILQPTRVVKRKGIEHAIELIHHLQNLGIKAKLVISHASGDEGYAYEQRVKHYSETMNVNTIFVSDIIGHCRGETKCSRKIYTLYDIYPYADLVTYPSNIEGFGNAFLEAVYFCKPIVVNSYSIYSLDIKPKGFDVIEIDGYVSEDAVNKTKQILEDQTQCNKMVAHNYTIASRYYSYAILREKLRALLAELNLNP